MDHACREAEQARQCPEAQPVRCRAPTAGQVWAWRQLGHRLACGQPIAVVVRGSRGAGKDTVVAAALRSATRPSLSYTCLKDISPPAALAHIESLTAAVTDARLAGLTLILREPQMSVFPEAFIRAAKRFAAANGFSLLCLLDDKVASDDTAYAFSRRTHGIRTVTPVILPSMDEEDALRFTLARWKTDFPDRPMPEHLAHTLLGVCAHDVGEFDKVWLFARELYGKRAFASPGEIWEYRRPSEDNESDAALDPNGGPPFYPDPEVLMAVEMELDCL